MSKPFRTLCIALLVAAAVLRLAVFITSCRNIPVTTDEAITVLQAKRIAEGELQWLMYAQPYMFPIEAYAYVPFLPLPRNAWGMRTLMLLEGIALLAIWLATLRKSGTWSEVFPATLLILFPSSYLLIYTFGYAPPHYLSAFILSFLGLLGTTFLRSDDLPLHPRLLLLAGVGFSCGLAFSNSMFALTIAAPVVIVALINGNWKRLPLNAIGLAGGILVGLIPFLYTLKAFPGSHAAVSRHREWSEVGSILTGHATTFTLPRTLGIGAPVFPDESVYGWNPEALVPSFGVGVMIFLLACTLWRIVHHLRTLLKGNCPCLNLTDFAIGVSLLNLLVFARASRSSSGDFRYLLPVATALPFVIAGLAKALPRKGRLALTAAISLYALANAASMVRSLGVWSQPDFGRDVVGAPDLQPAIDLLDREGIRHAYAQYWNTYRINFLTDERILCSQVYNSRFFTWKLPYKKTVDTESPAAYVLTHYSRAVTPERMQREMDSIEMTATRESAGEFEVFYSFNPPASRKGLAPIPAEQIQSITSEDFPGDLTPLWTDQNLFSRSHSKFLQKEGMTFTVSFTQPFTVGMLGYNIGFWREDEPGALHVDAKIGDQWVRILENGVRDSLPFDFRNDRPIYGGAPRQLAFGPVNTSQLRITLTRPRSDRAWTFSELTFFEDLEESP
jgi:hypothetical protein